jgi:hypothetical protein
MGFAFITAGRRRSGNMQRFLDADSITYKEALQHYFQDYWKILPAVVAASFCI